MNVVMAYNVVLIIRVVLLLHLECRVVYFLVPTQIG